ncbi:hypothetical protein AB0E25_39270 [Streptomyces bobili]|uniref:hypothetical protein n=1 Tax=Streptomyces bobili TaxID=67280 RepID=UPI0033F6BDE3
MARLGLPRTPLLAGPRGEPLWPDGWSGRSATATGTGRPRWPAAATCRPSGWMRSRTVRCRTGCSTP